MNDRFLKALNAQNFDRPPVWIMRQAGRYLPEYQKLRQKHTLWQMFHNSELATQVTLLPIDLFQVDAAILFSDILVIAEVFGLKVIFPEKGGPYVEPSLKTPRDVSQLKQRNVKETLSYVSETIRNLRSQLKVPLIGFCGGPFTVASYLIDQGSKNGFQETKRWIQEHPESFHQLLEKITQASIEYLRMQIEAGVQTVQIFDSWANVLDDAEFSTFSLHYLERIISAIHIPTIIFCRNSSLRAEKIAVIQPKAISFDWHKPMSELRKLVPQKIAIQGNLNPDILKDSISETKKITKATLEEMRAIPNFIFNLGHGVLPETPLNHVKSFVDQICSFS